MSLTVRPPAAPVVWFDTAMRLEATATSMSWIPSEIVTGALREGFEPGLTHYDPVPPDWLAPGEVDRMRDEDLFRFANVLAAGPRWRTASSPPPGTRGLGAADRRHPAAGRPARCQVPRRTAAHRAARARGAGRAEVRLVQTVGGRTGAPLPRPVPHRQLVQWSAPVVWTTVALTLRADGSSAVELIGASGFPRHWVYGTDGRLAAKSGVTDQAGG